MASELSDIKNLIFAQGEIDFIMYKHCIPERRFGEAPQTKLECAIERLEKYFFRADAVIKAEIQSAIGAAVSESSGSTPAKVFEAAKIAVIGKISCLVQTRMKKAEEKRDEYSEDAIAKKCDELRDAIAQERATIKNAEERLQKLLAEEKETTQKRSYSRTLDALVESYESQKRSRGV